MSSATIQFDAAKQRFSPLWLAAIPAMAACLAVSLLSNQWVVAGAAAVAALAVVLLLWPDAATVLGVFVIYTNAAVVAVRFHNLPFFVGAAAILLFAWPFFWKTAVLRERIIIASPTILVFLFLTVQLLSVFASDSPDVAMETMKVLLAECMLLFLFITNVVRSWATLRVVVWSLVCAGGLMGSLGAFQYVTATRSCDYGGFAQVPKRDVDEPADQDDTLRFAGPLGEKNYFAQFMLMLIPLAIFPALSETSRVLRLASMAACVFVGVGIALTYSRGAALGFLVMVGVMLLLGCIKVRHVALFAAVSVGMLISVPHYGQRLLSLAGVVDVLGGEKELQHTDKATQGRLTEMAAAALVFAERPLLGVGPGMFRHHFVEKADALGFQVHGVTRRAHCAYLEIAAEHGAAGLLLFLAILGTIARRLYRLRIDDPRPEVKNMATAFLLALVSMSATSVFLSLAYVRYYWLILALATAVDNIARVRNDSSLSALPASPAKACVT